MADIKFDMEGLVGRLSGEKQTDSPESRELLRVSYATDTGLFRVTNEDSFFIDGKCTHVFGETERGCYDESEQRTHVFGVFDGMGGEEHGEVASELCARALGGAFGHILSAEPEELYDAMTGVCRSANAAICRMIKERRANAGGSTFAAACICENRAHIFWLGDSRVYFFEKGKLRQLTSDQTVAAAKIAQGLYTPEEAADSRDHHALMNFVGMNRLSAGMTVTACEPVPFRKGCALLICSDGLTDMISDGEIAQVLSVGYPSPAGELVTRALLNGGMDNVTCVVIEKKR